MVDGIVVAGTLADYQQIKKNIPAGFPLICIDRTVVNNPFSAITISNYDSMYRDVKHLISKGHRKITYFPGDARFSTTTERFSAYKNALINSGIPFDDSIVSWRVA